MTTSTIAPGPERKFRLGTRLSRAILPVYTGLVVVYLFSAYAIYLLGH